MRDRREGVPAPEDQTVRQYRYLLLRAPLDAAQAVHVEAFGALPSAVVDDVLAAVRRGLGAGEHLDAGQHRDLARLLVLGERREPRAALTRMGADTVRTLARAALDTEAAFGHFSGYADWDGTDPEPPELPDSGWTPHGWRSGAGAPAPVHRGVVLRPVGGDWGAAT